MGNIVSSILDPFTGASSTTAAAAEAANQQRRAAMMQQFRPIGMTTRFGTSTFNYALNKPLTRRPGETDEQFAQRNIVAQQAKGTLTGAGYELSPELKSIQDALFGLTGGAVATAQGATQAAMPLGTAAERLFGLGSQYLATSPEEARQRYMDEQMAILDPVRAREEARLGSSVFGRGRANLNIGSAGQPELFALAQARREQELKLAADAERAAQQRISFGQNLFGDAANLLTRQYSLPGSALAPIQAYLGTIGSIEEMGQQPYSLSMALAGAQQPGKSAAAQLMSQAAQTQYAGQQAANAANANFIAGLLGAGSNIYGMNTMANAYASRSPTMFLGG